MQIHILLNLSEFKFSNPHKNCVSGGCGWMYFCLRFLNPAQGLCGGTKVWQVTAQCAVGNGFQVQTLSNKQLTLHGCVYVCTHCILSDRDCAGVVVTSELQRVLGETACCQIICCLCDTQLFTSVSPEPTRPTAAASQQSKHVLLISSPLCSSLYSQYYSKSQLHQQIANPDMDYSFSPHIPIYPFTESISP